MTKANLPPLNIPTKFQSDPEVSAFFNVLTRALYDLFQRTGGGVDLIADLEGDSNLGVTPLFSRIGEIEKRVEEVRGEMHQIKNMLISRQGSLSDRVSELESSSVLQQLSFIHEKIDELEAKLYGP